MKLFGIEGKGLLISVGITIIMCGAVTYYCHMRVKNVEVALMKQNQVLSSFITNVQSEIRKGGLIDNAHVDLSSPEARNAVKNLENSKIEVSDDESDCASETDDDEDDSASETDDSDSDDDEETDISNSIKISKEDIKIVDIQAGSLNDFMNDNKIIDLEEITDFANLQDDTDEDDSDDDSISDNESVSAIAVKNIKPEVKKINLSQAQVIVENKQEPEVVNVNIINIEELLVEVDLDVDVDVNVDIDNDSNGFIKKIVKTEDKEKEKTSNINKMKIDDLREKAVLSGLGTNESLKKLKKADLITLLTNNK
jgi:hypothetical protein